MSGDDEDNNEEKKELAWSAHYDDEGRLYYYNSQTEESSWDPPEEGFNPAEEPAPERDSKEDTAAATEEEGEPAAEAANEPAEAAAGAQWVAYKDDDGNEYFYNSVTGETQWDRPEGEVAEANEEGAAADTTTETATQEETTATSSDPQPGGSDEPMADADGDADNADAEAGSQPMEEDEPEPAEEVEPEPEIDPAVLRLQEAREALSKPDSVMEPNCIANVTEVVTMGDEGNPQKALAALLENFVGQTAICGLVCQWLSSLRRSSRGTSKANEANHKKETEDDIRQATTDVIHKVANERFSKKRGDGILDLSRKEAAFLESMMDSTRWRRLLIDLSAKHKDSALLTYCLRAISKRGYHREIASRINQSDHFTVFNAMLSSELSIIGKLAAFSSNNDSNGNDNDTNQGVIVVADIFRDLTRTCTSTSYTYLYSLEFLRYLLTKARKLLDSSSTSPNVLRRAIRKWEALAQELEMSMMDPALAQSAAGSSTLFRKRRLDVALTVSSLSARRKRPREESTSTAASTTKLEGALANFLRRYSAGISIDDKVLNSLLPSGLDLQQGADVIGKLFIQYPLAIQAMLVCLYKPGSSRVSDPVTKNKCAKLISLATVEAEKAAAREAESRSPDSVVDELSLSRMILEGSQLCEQLETMVSFLAAGSKEGVEQTAGQKLCALASECAPVAQGVLLWAKHLTAGAEFAGAASFPTLSVSILSLVRLVAIKQPFVRGEALQVALAFLRHTNSDISYQTITAIREQSLRLMIVLVVYGKMAETLNCITIRLKQKQSDLDASLVRYFVGGILEVVAGGVSVAFIRSMGALLLAPRCLEAVSSSYFKDSHRAKLNSLLLGFSKMKLRDEKDLTLVKNLLEAYKPESK